LSRHNALRIEIFDRLLDRQARLSASSAEERLCHLLLGVYRRSRARGLTGPRGRCALPLSQSLLASACGLAPGNVNRILSVLRQAGILIFDRGAMQVLDEGLLARRAGMAEDAQNARPGAEPAAQHSGDP
jgi:CRP-like cAMP-binding protein